MNSTLLLAWICLAIIGVSAQRTQRGRGMVEPTLISGDQDQPSEVTVDDESVYWVNNYSAVQKVSKAGGAPTTIATGRAIYRLFVDKDYLYFSALGEIRRVNKNGGDPITIATVPSMGYQGYPSLAMDETNIYFMDAIDDYRYKVVKVSKSGGAPVTLASRKIYLPTGLVSDGANLYWTDLASSTVKRVNVNGGPTVIFGTCNNPAGIAADADRVYCLRKSGEVVGFRKIGGGSIKPSAVGNYYPAGGMPQDEMNVYFMSFQKGTYGIYKVGKKGGGAALSMPMSYMQSTSLAVDDTSIYWTNYNQGTVMRLRK
jgi:hypothetical protein